MQYVRIRTNRGFTLVEMIIVLAIIGILTSMTFPIAKHVRNRSTYIAQQSDALRFQNAIYDFSLYYHCYPYSLPQDTWFDLSKVFKQFIDDFSGQRPTNLNPEGIAFCSFTKEEYLEKRIKPLWFFIQKEKTRNEAVQELKAHFTSVEKIEGTNVLFYLPK